MLGLKWDTDVSSSPRTRDRPSRKRDWGEFKSHMVERMAVRNHLWSWHGCDTHGFTAHEVAFIESAPDWAPKYSVTVKGKIYRVPSCPGEILTVKACWVRSHCLQWYSHWWVNHAPMDCSVPKPTWTGLVRTSASQSKSKIKRHKTGLQMWEEENRGWEKWVTRMCYIHVWNWRRIN